MKSALRCVPERVFYLEISAVELFDFMFFELSLQKNTDNRVGILKTFDIFR